MLRTQAIKDELNGHILLWHSSSSDWGPNNEVHAGIFCQAYRFKIRARIIEWDGGTRSYVHKHIVTVPYSLIFSKYLPEHETLQKCRTRGCAVVAPSWTFDGTGRCNLHDVTLTNTIWSIHTTYPAAAAPVGYARAVHAFNNVVNSKTSNIITKDGYVAVDASHLTASEVAKRLGEPCTQYTYPNSSP